MFRKNEEGKKILSFKNGGKRTKQTILNKIVGHCNDKSRFKKENSDKTLY